METLTIEALLMNILLYTPSIFYGSWTTLSVFYAAWDFILPLLLLSLVLAIITITWLDQKWVDRDRRKINVFEKSEDFLCLLSFRFLTTYVLLVFLNISKINEENKEIELLPIVGV